MVEAAFGRYRHSFAIISMYVPVIGSFINFLWPLPIAICGMRNGLRWSVMTLIVADIAVAVLISRCMLFRCWLLLV